MFVTYREYRDLTRAVSSLEGRVHELETWQDEHLKGTAAESLGMLSLHKKIMKVIEEEYPDVQAASWEEIQESPDLLSRWEEMNIRYHELAEQ